MIQMITLSLLLIPSLPLFTLEVVQSLAEPSSNILSLDITADNSMIVMGGNDKIVFVYSNTGTQFISTDNLTGFGSDLWAVDVTADGQWLLAVEFDGVNRIYQFDALSSKFQLFQIIDTGLHSVAGAMTDDHQWLVLTQTTGFFYIYTFNGTMFVLKESHPSPVFISPHLFITNDHIYIAFLIHLENAYVYKYDGTNYTLYANISDTYKLDAWNYVHITEDH